MTTEELLAECKRKQEVSGHKDIGVYLVVPNRRLPRYAVRIRLFGRWGPLGELINETDDGDLVGIFPADGIVRALTKIAK